MVVPSRRKRSARKLGTLTTLARGAVLLAFALQGTVFAQSRTAGTGIISGTARDASGLVLPGATIAAKNLRTGEAADATSSAQGTYAFAGLTPSTYTVTARLTGFAPVEFKEVQLLAGQEVRLDITLAPATQSETVTVTAEAPLLDVSDARMGANVNEREVSTLPINGRQLSQLYLQAPGALNSGTGTFGDIRFSGRAVEQNIVRYDGVEGSAIVDASPGNLNGEIASPFRLQSSLENVQEFRVDSNNYPAEYGTGTGGQVTVVTKSGSNSFHGGLFEYFRDDSLDRPNAFDPVVDGEQQKSNLRLHQFGASFGGPLVKDKAFFYASYEGYRLNSGINFVEAVPSAAARARAVPAVAPLLDAFKDPRAIILPGASANPDFDIAQLQDESRVNEDAFSGRIDVRFSQKHKFYARYFRDNGDNDQPEGVTGRRQIYKARPENAVAALQSTLTPNVVNELKVGYNRANTEINGVAPIVNGIDLSAITHQHHGQRGQHRHRRPGLELRRGHPGRAAAAEQRQQRPRRPLPALHAVGHGLHRLAAWPALLQARRRVPHRAREDGPARRHDLHVLQPERLPGQPPPAGPVPRRPFRAQPLPQWRDGRARGEGRVLHRLPPGRVEGRAPS